MIFVFFAILSLLNLSSGIELKCSFVELPLRGGLKSCDLSEKTTISAESVQENFTFTGLNEEQKNEVRIIRFQTANISFVPDEATQTFPNLEGIEVFDRNLTILTFDYVNELLKFVKPKITEISFWSSQINEIDPQIITFFENMTGVYLKGNQCIDENFETSDELNLLEPSLEACFDNFKEVVCSNDEFFCDDKCIDISKKCNNIYDCDDEADEFDCPKVPEECKDDEFRCDDSECITVLDRCNGFIDCDDDTDEKNCPSCKGDAFYCVVSKKCIPGYQRCNGSPECLDASDEEGCSISKYGSRLIACSFGEWKCNSGECIDERYRCDNRPDCIDSSDEYDCSVREIKRQKREERDRDQKETDQKGEELQRQQQNQTQLGKVPEQAQSPCYPGEWQCKSGECIIEAYRCDETVDCPDGSDEINCSETESEPEGNQENVEQL